MATTAQAAAQRVKEALTTLKTGISDYFRETTVHGFRYVVEGSGIIERSLWIAIITIGFVLSAILIQQSFQNWEETPLQTTIETIALPIEELYFPAVTVCNLDSLKMPRRNRWLFLEKLLRWVKAEDPTAAEGK